MCLQYSDNPPYDYMLWVEFRFTQNLSNQFVIEVFTQIIT
jgi:hypothetical protein